MEKTFLLNGGGIITKQELEGMINNLVDNHIKRMEKLNSDFYCEYPDKAHIKPLVEPRDLSPEITKDITESLYKKFGIPENYFN